DRCATADRTASASAHEAGERRRKLDGAQALERSHARALLALESRALRALAEMGAKCAPLGRGDASVHPPDERRLCLAAGERALELLSKRAPTTEKEGLHGGDAHPERVADLGVRPALELSHDQRRALVEGERSEGCADLVRRGDRLIGRRRCRPVLPLDDLRSPGRGPAPPPALVLGDLQQPVAWLPRLVAAKERAIGAQERRLSRVFGGGPGAPDGQGAGVT